MTAVQRSTPVPALWLLAWLIPTVGLADGFSDKYRVLSGDYNNDGNTDLYVAERPQIVFVDVGDILAPIVLPPPVRGAVLQQNPVDKTFDIVGNPSDIVLSQWAETPYQVLQGDFNFDGYSDLAIKGVGATITGASDQLLFADSTNGAPPVHVRAMDAEFRAFVEDAYRWIEDEFHFERASLANGWYDVEDGPLQLRWWSVAYLWFWGYTPAGGGSFVDDYEDAFDPEQTPNGCTPSTCYFDYISGVWAIWGWAREHELVYDNFYQHFNDDAVDFGKAPHESLEELIAIIMAKIEIEIGGKEIVIVAGEIPNDIPAEDPFWDDILMRGVLHDIYCVAHEGGCVIIEDVTSVDLLVERTLEGSYTSGECQNASINYTSGTYEITSTNGLGLNGYTLERGGPDSKTPARNADKCTNKPKRIPQGVYSFSMGSTNSYQNVPVVETTGIGRTGILVHSAVGAAGTIGCILVAKTSGSTGTFTGGRASSLAALAEIQAALTINSGGVAKWLFSYGYLTVENDM